MFVALLGLATSIPPRPLAPRQPILAVPANDNGVACTICQELVRAVDDYLDDGKTQEEIIAELDILCNKLPATYATLCSSLVAQYLPVIINWLEQEMEIIDICTKIGLCKNSAKHIVRVPAGAKNGLVCDTCKQLVSYVETLLDDGKTQAEIIALAQKLCDTIPAPYGAICDSLVASFIPQIIAWLEKEIEVLDVCRKLGLCTEAVKKIRIPAKADNGFVCDTCKQLVAYVETLLEEQKTQEEIIALAQKLCDKIPAPYGAICDSLVASYIPQIINWLEQELEVIDVCRKLGLCTEAVKKAPVKAARRPNTLAERAHENGFGCSICKDFVQWVEKELTDYSIPALWKLVSVDCQKVKYLCKFCALITEQDIQTILNLILNKLPPAKVCEWIKIC